MRINQGSGGGKPAGDGGPWGWRAGTDREQVS